MQSDPSTHYQLFSIAQHPLVTYLGIDLHKAAVPFQADMPQDRAGLSTSVPIPCSQENCAQSTEIQDLSKLAHLARSAGCTTFLWNQISTCQPAPSPSPARPARSSPPQQSGGHLQSVPGLYGFACISVGAKDNARCHGLPLGAARKTRGFPLICRLPFTRPHTDMHLPSPPRRNTLSYSIKWGEICLPCRVFVKILHLFI